ncbi:sulfatase [bacterium]|nr:sulfatase [bacterium]
MLLGTGCGRSSPRSLVIVTLDTTRVDHLSPYGYQRGTTPNLEAFARRAVRFRRAWSTSSWTLPAHASLFTGLYPAGHGAHYDARGGAVLGSVVAMPVADFVRAGQLGENNTTLAEILRERGYRTGAFVAGPWLHRGFGLLQGFETTDDEVPGFAGRSAELITDRAIRWLEGGVGRAPYFLFLNYFDPHAPYRPPPGFDDLPRARAGFEPPYSELMTGEHELTGEERSILVDRYDGEIRFVDHHLGRLLDAVLSRPGGENTLVVVTADHGEAFGEGGRFGHGFWLSEELLHVPLLVRFPGDRRGGSSDDALVQLVDVLPLVAAELDFDLPEGVEGLQPGSRDVGYAEIYREPTTVARFGERYDRDLSAVISWPHVLVRSDRGERSLYHLDDIATEMSGRREEAVLEQLETLLEEHQRGRTAVPVRPTAVDSETLEALRRLGYVH